MAISIYKISEQIRASIDGGDSPAASRREMEEVKEAVIQVVNGMIKAQHFTETMGLGEYIPDGAFLTQYDDIAVESYKNVSRATLPAMPVNLPFGIGIYHVGKNDDFFNGFIPFQAGELQMIGGEPILSEVLGQIAYEPNGKYIVFNRDITVGDDDTAITSICVRLVVKDLALYSDYEMLPIPASMESELIQKTFEILNIQLPANKKVDVVNKPAEA